MAKSDSITIPEDLQVNSKNQRSYADQFTVEVKVRKYFS